MKNQEFDFSVDILQALLWRWNNAPNLTSLLMSKQTWYDENQTDFWNDWFTNVFDLTTANDFGCAVWAIILKIPLAVIAPPDYLTKPVWGFGTHHKNFNRGNFAIQKQTTLPLTLAQKRLVLQLRFLQLITRGTVTEINRDIATIFARNGFGSVYVLDGLDMTCDYVFTFVIPSALNFVLLNYDILPRPAGVKLNIRTTVRSTFGFGSAHMNFNRGNFGE